MPPTAKRCWFTFPTRSQVEQPIIWQMSRKFPDVMLRHPPGERAERDRHHGRPAQRRPRRVNAAIEFLPAKGVTVEPIEKSVVEG